MAAPSQAVSARWREHSPVTDPGQHSDLLRDVPTDIAGICRIVGHLLIHGECLELYGLREEDFPELSRETLPASDRLARIHREDGRSLLHARDPAKRSIGTCRDYAVMTASILRFQGAAARIRCGFASYLDRSGWEDHWVCERWIAEERRWAVADAQMDDVSRAALDMEFDHTDLPPAAFMSAGEAWLGCRLGKLDPACFGHGETLGLWFVAVNVVRDHLALNHQETSAWDTWRKANPAQRRMPLGMTGWIEEIAERPERPTAKVPPPPWQ